ncbi:hydroxymethylbilane synthase [Novosphingobium sp. Gsoil 351]|uniref:hydroxymethylbilane synthase n=1 Tax=Novosphingobium sp. Gsoil 351 TaxID=2675225 RepID=UPI0012B45625|nr:hydroxymethylbilane synthase [Novosphingobium sp. Gsoil 351]QGN56188.1 hydroxymethylbilane synthase [Novosphingobium sp. Gsoil 351]
MTPSSDRPLRLGTRRSPLALAQAEETRARLCAAHGWPESAVELVTVIASGDRVQDRPLSEIGGKALWTKELDAWLDERRIDAAVHSMKDVETVRPAFLTIAAILPREDVRDVLVGAASIAAIPAGARVGTSAPRRAAQMLHARPDVTVLTFRGNVATRIAKLAAGEADVTLLAAAGLARLGENGVGTPLECDDWMPAPAQGAIGIECRAILGKAQDDRDLQVHAWLSAIDHPPSRAEVMAERALLAALGGNCHSPVAVLCRHGDDGIDMRAALFSEDGAARIERSVRFAPDDADGPARLAREMLSAADPEIVRLFAGPGG